VAARDKRYTAGMKTAPLAAPSQWLDGLASSLCQEFEKGGAIEGVAGGAMWLSLRVDGRFLWLMSPNDIRAAWWTDSPAPRDWLQILRRHRDSPFARELRGQILTDAAVLENEGGKLDGLQLGLRGGGRIALRFFPRPGALWVEGADGEIRAQQGRMDGEPLSAVAASGVDFEADLHAARCHAAVRNLLDLKLQRWLETKLRGEQDRRRRRLLAQESDLAAAMTRLDLREKADLLAANLHSTPAGQKAVVLIDFDGETRSIELDPKLTPAQNLESLYRRAAKAERTVATLRERLAEMQGDAERDGSPLERLEATKSFDERIELAHELEIPLAPADRETKKRGGGPPTTRLPYLGFRLSGGEEIRVGRSAKDNDALLRQHSAGKDLWLHAQGVEGSHVILRQSGTEPTPAVIEAAARVAAEFSKAKHSKLVPVLVTERRYVRKPRKAAPGAVVAERGKTYFVEPGLPDGCERIRSDDSS
jgi:hypothetical protein